MNLANVTGSWFAVQVKPRVEQTIALLLRSRGYEVFLPLNKQEQTKQEHTRRSDSARALFPGYLFCRFDTSVQAPIVTTPGVVRIVGYGSQPVCIPDQEIEAIRVVAESGLRIEEHGYIQTGQLVEVCIGPLRGAVGKVIAAGKKRCFVVSIAVLQRAIAVELEEGWLKPIDGAIRNIARPETGYVAIMQSQFGSSIFGSSKEVYQ